MYDIVIIGAGPAGLTAAIYALRANKKVLIIEANIYGGQIVNASKIENYPGILNISGYDFASALYNQVKSLGGQFKLETVIRIDKDRIVITDKDKYGAKAIIIATGAKNRKLKVENESKFIGKGISYCATCDGNFYKDKDVAVVGGGNTAVEDALYLADIARKVYLIHRRDSFRADEIYLNDLRSKKNVEFILNSNICKINGSDHLNSLSIKNYKDEIKTLCVDGLFIAVGQEPKNEIFANLINLDEYGYILSEDGVHTNIEKIYVAGDARKKELRQLVTATSDGAIAATTAIKEME